MAPSSDDTNYGSGFIPELNTSDAFPIVSAISKAASTETVSGSAIRVFIVSAIAEMS